MRIGELWWQFLLLAIGSYLIGNINFAIIISKFKKRDIRTLGSGNPGTLNMSRNFGLKIGVLTLLLDIVKGVVPTLVGYLLYNDNYFINTTLSIEQVAKVGCGFFAVLGHVFPVFMKFKGGKGIATTIGVFAVCNPIIAIISGALAIIFILFTEIGAMGSFIATTPGAIAMCYSVYVVYIDARTVMVNNMILASVTNLFAIAIIFLTWYAHRKNIKRMLTEAEHPTNWLQSIRESRIKKNAKLEKETNETKE
ncbi:MAG: glycerol-3-phosphate acyltransferase [Clostridia bacterium]|nr:glycerol-3-phosphate acyltransferase [Clostridia bacterium]